MKRVILFLIVGLVSSVSLGSDELVLSMPSIDLEEKKVDPVIDHFARYGFQDFDIEKADDTQLKEILKRLDAIEERLDKMNLKSITLGSTDDEKPKSKTVRRIVGYQQICDGYGNCYDDLNNPIYETVTITEGENQLSSMSETVISSTSSSTVPLGMSPSGNVYRSNGRVYSNGSTTYSPPETVSVSAARGFRGSPLRSVDSNGTVYRVARLRTIARRLLGL